MSGDGVYTPPGRRSSSSGNGTDGSGTDGRNDSRELVVQQVKEAGVTLRYPVLTSSNYIEWSLLMKVNMQAQGVWDAVELGNTEHRIDRMALAAILQAVPSEMLATLASKDTAKEAWEAVRTMRMGVERVREAKAQSLRKEFELIRMKEGESVDDFAMRLTGLVNNIHTLGAMMEEEMVVKKFLRVVPSKYTQVAISIEQLIDLKTLSVEELTGRLKSVEERYEIDGNGSEAYGRLLLTEEQWMERMKSKKKKDTFDKAKVRCYKCQGYGHYSWEEKCAGLKEKQALLAVASADNEPTLL
uniref:Retroelement n=2 Tax=Oryza sativa subsp. japonica TaxID=39947 RepID=A0A5S6R946_ORYSJ|nr:Putative retroelement [Oryza sativa Japonica Group]AAN04951.1 Putative retroelement [Oryza sativa Japonica Group]AAP52934.1 retrotransposon protein, putative, Ty1-copia subclass [Oryza sativa Japonica Group]